MRKTNKDFLRSKEWLELRAQALLRDNHRCVLCGSSRNLNVHHIFPRKFHKDLQKDLDNLVVVCPGCHFRIHKDIGYVVLALFLMENRQD